MNPAAIRSRKLRTADLTDLQPAWDAYRRGRQSVWLHAPNIERHYLRTQDYELYTRQRRWLISKAAGLMTAWKRACKSVHSGAQVIPLGAALNGLPGCFLVRVPKPRSLVVDEHVFGSVRWDDRAGLDQLQEIRHRDAKTAQMARRVALERELAERMIGALTAARTHQALKARALAAREYVTPRTPEWYALARTSYIEHALHRRAWARAQGCKNRLAALGLSYDLALIDTPIVLP